MKKLFITLSSDTCDLEQTLIKESLEDLYDHFRNFGWYIGFFRGNLTFDTKNFLHSDMIRLITEQSYNISNMGLADFPTKIYSETGDTEYYFEKDYNDGTVKFCLNKNLGKITIENCILKKVESDV